MTAVLHTLRAGEGLPLVLLHAFPVDHRMWTDVAAAVVAPVLAADLPGMGAAAADAPAEPSIEAAADAVADALRAAGCTRAVVAGLSMGGYVALALAERHPDLVAGLGLLDTKSVADAPEARANRLRVADTVLSTGSVDEVLPMASGLLGPSTRRRDPQIADRVAGWIRAQTPAGVAWSQRAMAARPDRTAVLTDLAARGIPALVLVGDEDVATPHAQAQHMADALGVTPVVVPGAGHLTAVEAPAPVAAALTDLVVRADARA
jgi:pimeloyl-ACP methyl ester carboxylesterase